MGILLRKRANIHFSTLRNRSDQYKAELVKRFTEECIEDFKNGKLKPIIDKVFKMSEVGEAHKHMESNENIGKILL